MMNSLKAALVAVALLTAATAGAQVVPAFDLERLSLDPSAVTSMVVGTGQVRPAGQGRVSLAAHYENRPLVLMTDGTVIGRGLPSDGTRFGDVVENRVTAHLGASITLTDRLEVNFRLPIVVFQDGTVGLPGVPKVAASGMGTPAVGFRWQLAEQAGAGLNLAIASEILAPYGSAKALAGNQQWYFTPRVEASRDFGGIVVGGQGGLIVRERTLAFGGGSTLATAAAGGLVVATTGTLRGELSVRGEYSDYKNDASLEALLGARYAMGDFELFALGGPGFNKAPGTPKYRGVLGVAFAPTPKKAAPPPPPPAPVVDPCAPGQAHTAAQCPDLDDDGDGIKNKDDACPTVAGIPEEKGCPAKDTDGDGIFDHQDRCPTQAGPKENGGCPDPDRDGDGVVDRLDKCPDVAGTAEFEGCPPAKAKVNVETKKIDILEKVYFDTNKATIQQRSFALLDDVATVLGRHPEITRVVVEGHTDNTGAADYNLTLSDARAKAVREYLVGKGVAGDRLEAKGFGQERPVGDNKTKAGREQNRRVEFTIP
jgi:OOP family OmpA-OmpF porin